VFKKILPTSRVYLHWLAFSYSERLLVN